MRHSENSSCAPDGPRNHDSGMHGSRFLRHLQPKESISHSQSDYSDKNEQTFPNIDGFVVVAEAMGTSELCSDCMGEAPPASEPRIVDGKMENNSANRFLDPNCHFQESLSQGRDLGFCTICSGRSSAHLLHEHVGRCSHEDSKLIGQKARAACPIYLQTVMQFLDPILGISSAPVDLVNILRFVRKIGDYETVVVSGIAPRAPHHLSFDDDSAAVRPFACRIAGLAKEGFGFACLTRFHAHFSHQAAGSLFQSGVAGHAHQVLHALQFEIIEERGLCEATIEPDTKAGLRKCVSQPGQNPHQDSEGPPEMQARCRAAGQR